MSKSQPMDFSKLIEGISNVQRKTKDCKIDYDKCAFLMGLTGSGKSSLICTLAGITLEVT